MPSCIARASSRGYAAGIDSTPLEANASLRRLTRKDYGASYVEYVKELMREAGEEPVDAAAVARFGRKRKGKKLSNQDWQSKTDPDARIAKMMKDGEPISPTNPNTLSTFQPAPSLPPIHSERWPSCGQINALLLEGGAYSTGC